MNLTPILEAVSQLNDKLNNLSAAFNRTCNHIRQFNISIDALNNVLEEFSGTVEYKSTESRTTDTRPDE
jgi:hypothetical protein